MLGTVGGRACFPPSSLSRGASWLGDSCPGSQLRGRPAGAQGSLIRAELPGLFLCHCLQLVASCYGPSTRDPLRPLPCPGLCVRCWTCAGEAWRSQPARHTPKAAAGLGGRCDANTSATGLLPQDPKELCATKRVIILLRASVPPSVRWKAYCLPPGTIGRMNICSGVESL